MQGEWSNRRLIEMSGSTWAACTLHAALNVGIFDALAQPLTAAAAAEAIACSERGTAMLLRALTALGLLQREGSGYACTPFSQRSLRRDSPEFIGHILLHHHHLIPAWFRLDDAVRSGRPVRTSSSHTTTDEERSDFLLGMFNMAMQLAPAIAADLDLSGCRRLLDLGGGPGTYAIHFCLANPQLEATVFDLETTRPFAETTIRRFGLFDRIRFESGDFLQAPAAAGYDVAWLSHILHGDAPDDAARIVRQAAAGLAPGGRIYIHEFILDDDENGPLFSALFSLNMLVGTEGGQSYREADLFAMLRAAGAVRIERLAIPKNGPSGIICASF